jgi:hypothetical protein
MKTNSIEINGLISSSLPMTVGFLTEKSCLILNIIKHKNVTCELVKIDISLFCLPLFEIVMKEQCSAGYASCA